MDISITAWSVNYVHIGLYPKCDEKITNKIKLVCKFDGCFTVKSEGSRSGLCPLWKDQNIVFIQSFSNNHIDSIIVWSGKIWRFSNIYGWPEWGQKNKT